MEITVPYNFEPRPYQLELFQAVDGGCKRAFCIWHRRAGKDVCLWNYIIKKAAQEVGVYYYLFPTYTQGKKVIFDGINNDGFAFSDYIPKPLLQSKNGTELKFELVNGSIIQIVGTDKIDSVRGTNPKGVVFSEYAFQNPMAWEVIRPILTINGGWALFNTTPNGKNHAYDMYNYAKDNDDWFVQKLGIDDTGVVPQSVIQEERNTGMSEEMIQQEYYCSFDVGAIGSYYADLIQEANKAKRIGTVPFLHDRGIDIYFDLGMNDMMTMWFKQDDGRNRNFINYYEDNGKSLDAYYDYIRGYLREKQGKLGVIYLPHDSKKRDLITGKTIFQCFIDEFGAGHVELVPLAGIMDGVQAVRKVFPYCYFDAEACKQGVRCLENYKKDYDNEKKVFRKNPLHDWASHGADSFRYFAMSNRDEREEDDDDDLLDLLSEL